MSKLIGQQIQESEKINSLTQALVQEVTNVHSQIQHVTPAPAEFAASAQQKMEAVAAARGRPLHYPYIGTGSGRGPYVELSDGSIKMDLINGIGIHLMGHSHPRVMAAAVRGALADVVMQGNLQPNKEYGIFAEKLVGWAQKNSRMKHVWFATCGTMANENALKIARQKHSPARMILAFKDAFAGRSTMMAEVTDNPAYKMGLPEYHEVLRVPFYDKKNPQSIEKSVQALQEHINQHAKNISVFIFEPMLGEGGYQAAPREFFVPLLELCKKNNIAVWADEVQTFARTGELFAYETLNLGQYVDICTIAKTAQIGATLYTADYNPKPGLIAGTFAGSTVSMTTGMEILDILQEGFLGPQGRIQQIHKKFMTEFARLNQSTCKDKVQDPGGMGLMIAFTPFEGKKEQVDVFLKKLFNNGVIAFSCGKDPVRARFLVPAIITDQQIDEAISIIEKTIVEGV
ncbi:MAG: aminotransferase class III-fold pyridoxal phosphate-dependent enzyme [Pseudobdellovibrionaceae bacterium]